MLLFVPTNVLLICVIKNVASLHFSCVVVIVFCLFVVIININLSLSTLHVKQLYIYIFDQMDLLDLLSCPPQDDLVVLITWSTHMLILLNYTFIALLIVMAKIQILLPFFKICICMLTKTQGI